MSDLILNFHRNYCFFMDDMRSHQMKVFPFQITDLKYFKCTGVQSINNVYAIVNKVENVLVNTYIFDLIDNGVYVVYALYSSVAKNYLLFTNKKKRFLYSGHRSQEWI